MALEPHGLGSTFAFVLHGAPLLIIIDHLFGKVADSQAVVDVGEPVPDFVAEGGVKKGKPPPYRPLLHLVRGDAIARGQVVYEVVVGQRGKYAQQGSQRVEKELPRA